MLGITKLNKTLSVMTGIALLFVASISVAAAGIVRADISARGKVTVNEQPAISSSIVVSGSTITTGSDSGAMIGIGGNGRIELMPETTLTLDYGSNTISAALASGTIKVTNAIGIVTTITTPDAVIAADAGRSNTFAIDSSTSGSLTAGKLTVLSVTDKMKITAANGRVVSLVTGESVQDDDDDDDDDSGAYMWFGLAVFGGAVAAAIYSSYNNDNGLLEFGEVFISPNR